MSFFPQLCLSPSYYVLSHVQILSVCMTVFFFSQQHNQLHYLDALQNLTIFWINIFCLYIIFIEVELVLIFFHGGLIRYIAL